LFIFNDKRLKSDFKNYKNIIDKSSPKVVHCFSGVYQCTTIEGLSIFFYLIVVTSTVHIIKEVLRVNSALLVRIVLREE
jgi:hypothetical protein